MYLREYYDKGGFGSQVMGWVCSLKFHTPSSMFWAHALIRLYKMEAAKLNLVKSFCFGIDLPENCKLRSIANKGCLGFGEPRGGTTVVHVFEKGKLFAAGLSPERRRIEVEGNCSFLIIVAFPLRPCWLFWMRERCFWYLFHIWVWYLFYIWVWYLFDQKGWQQLWTVGSNVIIFARNANV